MKQFSKGDSEIVDDDEDNDREDDAATLGISIEKLLFLSVQNEDDDVCGIISRLLELYSFLKETLLCLCFLGPLSC